VTTTMLSDRLKRLEAQGIVERQIYSEYHRARNMFSPRRATPWGWSSARSRPGASSTPSTTSCWSIAIADTA
jgi:hypothetical protein